MSNLPQTHVTDIVDAPFRGGPPRDYSAPLLYASSAYFEAELATMASRCWQFVGTTRELARSNDWVRAQVFGQDVFVQNHRGELRGFSNVCQHRGFPIRREAQGRGPATCGFHAWTYDADGVPVGVSRNDELFAFTREEKRTRCLPRIRVEEVGGFVFAALDDGVPALESYLGRYAVLLRTIGARMGERRFRATNETQANWKLAYEVTLDEYHVPYVHPESFRAEPIPVWGCVYERDGMHSQLLRRRTADWSFASFWDDAAHNEYEFAGYKIHHLFPNLLIAVSRGLIVVTSYVAGATDRTIVEDWLYEVNGDPYDDAWWAATAQGQQIISGEDRRISEAQQKVATQIVRPPVFGALEERVAWFHEAYDEAVGVYARQRIQR